MVGAAVLPDVIRGMTEASAMRNPEMLRTRNCGSVTAADHFQNPCARADGAKYCRADIAGCLSEVVVGDQMRSRAIFRRPIGREAGAAAIRRVSRIASTAMRRSSGVRR